MAFDAINCDACTGELPALWVTGETPSSVWIRFTGIENCDGDTKTIPNDIWIELYSWGGGFCTWDDTTYSYEGNSWIVSWDVDTDSGKTYQLVIEPDNII